jgi:hypothetical protein
LLAGAAQIRRSATGFGEMRRAPARNELHRADLPASATQGQRAAGDTKHDFGRPF